MILLDTHVGVWLYAGDLQRIPTAVQQHLEREALGVSPFACLELQYLYEVGKITVPGEHIYAELSQKLELSTVDSSIATVCTEARKLAFTRDPFDRLIAAHAIAADMWLVTKDRTIRNNLNLAWWSD